MNVLGCSSNDKDSAHIQKTTDQKQVEKIFYFNNGSEPEYLDPGLASDGASFNIIINLFEGLIEYDNQTLQPKPAVATHWDISPDGKVYTFHLRQNAKWSDDSLVTAHDFVYSWQRVVNPITASRYAYIMYFIKNATAINKGTIKDMNQLGVTAIDNFTLRVELENPTPFFPSIVAGMSYRPVKKAIIEKYGDKWTLPQNIVGNGYFKLSEWIPQKQITVVRNDLYWDKQNVPLDKVIFYAIEDAETGLKKYLKGEIHYMYDVPLVKKEMLSKRDDYHDMPLLGSYAIIANIQKPPMDNKKFRQALAFAIDRQKLVKVINRGKANASYTPKGIGSYEPPQGTYFDPDKARQLLKESGYVDGTDIPEITLIYNTSENHKMIMQVIRNMWKVNLGIQVNLLNMEWKVLLKTKNNMDFHLARAGWIGDYADPHTFLNMYTSTSSYNFTNWSNARYDELIAKSMTTLDQKKRNAYFYEAEKILMDEAPLIAIFTYTRAVLASKLLENFHANAVDVHPLKYVNLKNK